MPVKVINNRFYESRKVQKVGGSLVVSLPFDWCLSNGIEEGDEVLFEYEHGVLSLLTEEEARDKSGTD